MPTAQESIDAALVHHAAGRLAEAETIYRQVLSREPENPAALHRGVRRQSGWVA